MALRWILCSAATVRILVFALAVTALCVNGEVRAQGARAANAFPSKPIRIIIPFAPGGSNDIFGRFIGQKLTARLGQQTVIDNRAGANGIIGMDLAAKASPDGYTLAIVTVTFTMNPAINELPYDPIRSFTPISPIATGPNVLAVRAAFPANTIGELIALAKSKPGQLRYATSGTGGVHHFGGELFKLMAGVDMVAVPYKGGAPAMIDVIGGQVEVLFNTAISTLPHLRSGKLKALGVSSAQRIRVLPEVPTISEAGVHGYEGSMWWGISGPAHMPAEIVARLNAEISKILRDPSTEDWLEAQVTKPWVATPAVFANTIASDIAKWAEIARKAHIKAD